MTFLYLYSLQIFFSVSLCCCCLVCVGWMCEDEEDSSSTGGTDATGTGVVYNVYQCLLWWCTHILQLLYYYLIFAAAELPPITPQGPSVRTLRPLRPTPTSSNGIDLDPPDFDSLTPPPPYTDVESKPGLDDNCGEDDVYYIPYMTAENPFTFLETHIWSSGMRWKIRKVLTIYFIHCFMLTKTLL